MMRLFLVLGLNLVAISNGFADTITFICDYPNYSDNEGLHKVETEFKLTFIVDTEKESAYMLGNQGSSPVELVPNTDGLSFIEITGTGNVMTTTIASNGKSIHSRNSLMLGDVIPSQYYGFCEAK